MHALAGVEMVSRRRYGLVAHNRSPTYVRAYG